MTFQFNVLEAFYKKTFWKRKHLRIILVCLFVTKLERKIGAVLLPQCDAISNFHDDELRWVNDLLLCLLLHAATVTLFVSSQNEMC